MSLSVVTSGTLGAVTLNTETNIVAAQNPGSASTYVVQVDCGALVSGEIVILRIYGKVNSGGTERIVSSSSYIGGSDGDPIVTSIPFPTDVSWRPTITQQGGSGRSFPYKVFTL